MVQRHRQNAEKAINGQLERVAAIKRRGDDVRLAEALLGELQKALREMRRHEALILQDLAGTAGGSTRRGLIRPMR
jgi:hypothetical protein